MAYPTVVVRRTFCLKLNMSCFCDGCLNKLKDPLRKIQGIDSIDIDKEQGVATISGIVDPHRVIEKLQNKKKNVELLWEEKSPAPAAAMVDEKMQMLALHRSIVPPQLPGTEVVHKSIEKKVKDCKCNLSKHEHEMDPLQKKKKNVELLGEEKSSGMGAGVVHESIGKKVEDCECNPFKHEHEMVRKSNNKRFRCDGCKEEGFSARYRCDPCDYDLHDECMSPKPTISHDLFPGSIFQFSLSPTSTRFCDACGNHIHGYYYKCEAQNLDLHPRCSNLPRKLCIGDMKTVFILQDKVSSKCLWCTKRRHNLAKESQIEGWSYVSKCKKYHFHVRCVAEMVNEASKCDVAEENIASSETSKALETVDLQSMAIKSNKYGGKGTKYWKTVSLFLRAIVGILLGDPTVVLTSMLVELLSK